MRSGASFLKFAPSIFMANKQGRGRGRAKLNVTNLRCLLHAGHERGGIPNGKPGMQRRHWRSPSVGTPKIQHVVSNLSLSLSLHCGVMEEHIGFHSSLSPRLLPPLLLLFHRP